MWDQIKPVNTNQTAKFLNNLKKKQQQQDKQLRLNSKVIKIQAHIRRHLNNKKQLSAFFKESTEKIQSILVRKPTYEEDKFVKMMKNAITKMPFFLQGIAFLNENNYTTYSNFIVSFVKCLMDQQNKIILQILISGIQNQIHLIVKMVSICLKMAQKQSTILQFVQKFLLTIVDVPSYQSLISKIIRQYNFQQFWNIASKGILGEEARKSSAQTMIKKQVKSTKIDGRMFVELILQNKQTSIHNLNSLKQIYSRISFGGDDVSDYLRKQDLQSIFYKFNISRQLLEHILYLDDTEEIIIILQIHNILLSTFIKNSLIQIKRGIYKKNYIGQTQQNRYQIRDRTKITVKYSELLNIIQHPVYHQQLFEIFKNILNSRPSQLSDQSKSIIRKICEIYINLLQLLEIQQLQYLCSKEFIVIISSYLSFHKVKFSYIDENSHNFKVIFIYVAILNKHFSNMDDFQFSNPLVSYSKQFIVQTIKSIYKLLLYVIRKKSPSYFIIDMYQNITEFLTDVYNKNSRTSYFDNSVFNGGEQSSEVSYSLLKVAGIQKHISKLPFIVPFNNRYQIFRDSLKDQLYYYQNTVKIRRGHELKDAYNQLKNSNFNHSFQISFIGNSGQPELGIDAGGLLKQFLNRVIKDAFDPKQGLFIETASREMIPNPYFKGDEGYYQFVGGLVSKSITEDILVPVKLSNCFINLILGRKNTIQDLKFIDKDLYNNLVRWKHSKQDISGMELTFSYFDNNQQILLKQNGNNIAVTKYKFDN